LKRSPKIIAATVLLVALTVPAIAQAATVLYVTGNSTQRGVGGGRLGQYYTVAKSNIAVTPKTTTVDTSYRTTTYKTTFGYKSSTTGKYPIVMYANSSKWVYRFEVYSSAYKTGSGVGVGTLARTVRAKYPSYRKIVRPNNIVVYRLTNGGSLPYTDFVISTVTAKVTQIHIYK